MTGVKLGANQLFIFSSCQICYIRGMKLARTIVLLSMLAVAGPSLAATPRELDATELRQITRGGKIMTLKRVIDSVAKSTGGEPIEARAFALEDVFYRIVLKKANGSVISVIVNARTGEQIGKNSALGRQVSAAADAKGKGKGNKGKSQTAGSNGKSGGNSGGNGGGNGGGGNGGGNGGGGGGGNGGGGGGKN